MYNNIRNNTSVALFIHFWVTSKWADVAPDGIHPKGLQRVCKTVLNNSSMATGTAPSLFKQIVVQALLNTWTPSYPKNYQPVFQTSISFKSLGKSLSSLTESTDKSLQWSARALGTVPSSSSLASLLHLTALTTTRAHQCWYLHYAGSSYTWIIDPSLCLL